MGIGAHGHSHDGHGHSHSVSADADRKTLALALGIIATFMVVEVVAGLVANSLALLTDAAHMLTDAGAIGLALWAARAATRPSSGRYTYGWQRAEILSAQLNGATLLVLGGLLGFESVVRLLDPPEVEGGLVVVVGVIGGLSNIGAAAALARAQRRSLNVEGAMQHVLMDLFGSAAAVIAGVLVVTTGQGIADPLAALIVVILMLRSGWKLVRDANRILLEGTPQGMDADEIGAALAAMGCVIEVHDLHVWEVTSGFTSLSAHVVVDRDANCHLRRLDMEALLRERFGIDHTTIQVDHLGDHLVQLEM